MKTVALAVGVVCVLALPLSIAAHMLGKHALDLPPLYALGCAGIGALLIAFASGMFEDKTIEFTKTGIKVDDKK